MNNKKIKLNEVTKVTSIKEMLNLALIEDGDHMLNGHLVDLYKIVGHYVIGALSKKAPAKKRRGRRKKSEIQEALLLEGQSNDDDMLDDEADDFEDGYNDDYDDNLLDEDDE